MTTKIVFVIALIAAAAGMSDAQVALPEKGQEPQLSESVFGLGLWGGPATGLGLSFRHHLPSRLSYMVTGGILKVDDELKYDIGVEGQFDLIHNSTNRFFAAAGYGYYYSGKNSNEMEAPSRVGLGVGGEFSLTTVIHASVEMMFTYFSDHNVLPLPQVGVHYYFY